MIYFAAFGVALVLTVALMPPLIRFSGMLRLLDKPGERKVHAAPIPRVGGISMVLGVVLPVLLWVPMEREMISLLIGIAILFVFGLWDDRGDLDYRLKFLGQLLAASVVVGYGGIVIKVLPFFGLDPVSDWIAMPFSVVVIVAVTNSINLADGLDGLAAGMMFLTLAGTALLAYLSDGFDVLLLALAAMGAIMGFLRFNTFPARIFMGDTGSQFLGFIVATILIMLTQVTHPVLNPALPLLLLGVPLFDTAFVMVKRLYTGKSPFAADRNHIHHQILALKFNHYEAVVLIYLAQAVFVSTALVMRYESDLVVVLAWLLANTMLASIIIIAGRKRWYAHQSSGGSIIARMAGMLRSHHWYRYTLGLIAACVLAVLLAGPLLTNGIDREFGLVACILSLFLALRLVFGYRLWFVSLRLIAFVTIAFLIYLMQEYPAGYLRIPGIYETVFYGIIVAALLFGARFIMDEAFQVTPMDLLLVLVLVGLVFIPQAGLLEEDMIRLVIKVVIMFYAVEFSLRGIEKRVNAVTVGVLWALGVIAARGLVL